MIGDKFYAMNMAVTDVNYEDVEFEPQPAQFFKYSLGAGKRLEHKTLGMQLETKVSEICYLILAISNFIYFCF